MEEVSITWISNMEEDDKLRMCITSNEIELQFASLPLFLHCIGTSNFSTLVFFNGNKISPNLDLRIIWNFHLIFSS
jgi:hypothetical protein